MDFTVLITSRWLSWVPCDMLRRTAFIPASYILISISYELVEGPAVQIILVFLKGSISGEICR